MSKSGSKYMKIKIETETGKVVKVKDENNNPPTEMTLGELEQIYQSPDGIKYVGTILYAHSSPG